MLKMCLNWRVLAGLAAVGVGIYVFAPSLALAAAPFLLMAACPLSMLLMMRGMGNMQQGTPTQSGQPMVGAAVSSDARLARVQEQLDGLHAEHAALKHQIERERGQARDAITRAADAEHAPAVSGR